MPKTYRADFRPICLYASKIEDLNLVEPIPINNIIKVVIGVFTVRAVDGDLNPFNPPPVIVIVVFLSQFSPYNFFFFFVKFRKRYTKSLPT